MSRGAWRRCTAAAGRRLLTSGGRNGGGNCGGRSQSRSFSVARERCNAAASFDGLLGGARGLPKALASSVHSWRPGVMPGSCALLSALSHSRIEKSSRTPTRLSQQDPDAPAEPEKPQRRLNRAIVSRTVRLVTDEGHKVVSRMEALRHAENMDLDLVEIDGKQDPPVCKLMDFNKEKFKEKQRERQHKKKQSEKRRLDDVKEVRYSTRTEPNDLELKSQMASRLLGKGHRVKLSVIAHGNDDLAHKGKELIDRMLGLLQDMAKVENGPRIERQRVWVLIRPTSFGKQGTSGKGSPSAQISSESRSSDEDTEDS